MISRILYDIKKAARYAKCNIFTTLAKYVIHPIALRRLKTRCEKSNKNSVELYLRFYRMRKYQASKWQREKYRRNMEAIVKMAEDSGVAQHRIIANFDLDRELIKYKAKNGKLYGYIS